MSSATTSFREVGQTRTAIGYGVLGWQDLIDGARQWRLCHLLATADMRRRFARSKLGQIWIMLSSAIYISAIGVVWSQLWHQPPREILPYVAVGMMAWQLISSIINESTTALQTSSNYFLNQYTSTSAIVYAVIYRNTFIFVLNMVFPLLICIALGVQFTAYALLSILGAVLLIITCIWMAFVVAILCARFRDIVQIVSSVIQIVFFLTPILWKPELLPPESRVIVDWNPFAVLISIVRDPLLGRPVPLKFWLASCLLAFGGLLVTLPFFGRYRRRVVYWL
ncbi:MAG: ABC transporter permease [Hyphomicrobiales bacterium]|nr:ABC transporter permease [Acidobacteriaceae bacterium]MBV9976403.1 ABC transporter permease [Hyphomicrobiales bacterium]